MDNGDSLVLFNHQITEGPHYLAEAIYIDGHDINGVGRPVIKDRSILRDDGLVAIFVGLNSKTGQLIVPVAVETKGFIYQSREDIIILKKVAQRALEDVLKNKATFAEIKAAIRNAVSSYIERKTERSPMVIPVIMDQINVNTSK